MKSIFSICISIFLSFESYAGDIANNNPIISFLKTTNEVAVYMSFSDGENSPIFAPFEFKQVDPGVRCLCEAYEFSYNYPDGSRQTRRLRVDKDKNDVEFRGSNGAVYQLVKIIDRRGKIFAGSDGEDNCRYDGDPVILSIKTNSKCGDTKICYGEVRGCNNAYSQQVSCKVTKDETCPHARDCFNDENVDFKTPQTILRKQRKVYNLPALNSLSK